MIYGRVMTPQGVVRVPIRVSVQRAGLPQFVLQGLPGQTRQLRQILLTALKSSGWKMPHGRVVVDCQLPTGKLWCTRGLGLAVAVALISSAERSTDLDVVGALELDGSVALSHDLAALTLPLGVSLLTATPPRGVSSVMQQLGWTFCASLREYLHKGSQTVMRDALPELTDPDLPLASIDPLHLLSLSLVWAGGHSLLLFGAPGEGKTLSRSWLDALAPNLTEAELQSRLSLRCEWSASARASITLPSPTDSVTQWVEPRAGWLRQGSQGVLWMDEFSALPAAVRTRLRAWMEDTDQETLALRSRHWQTAFVATMNPCPCGYWGESRCVCSRVQVAQVLNRVSWPLLDRFALQWRVESLGSDSPQISPLEFRKLRRQIQQARDRQLLRSKTLNAHVALTDLPSDILRTEHAWRQRLREWSTRRQVQFCQVVQTLIDGEWAANPMEACEIAWLLCRGAEFLRKELPVTAR
jgi:magnesium chelatase family protein